VAEELRALAFDFDIPVWTAQQLNRCLFHKTPINTENGYKPLDELVVGDNIIGSNGNVVVEHIYPIEEQECYEITLKSGKKIICSDKHLFPTNNGLKSIETGLIIGDSFYVKCFNEHILVEILLIIPVGIKKTIDITVSGDNLFFANDILTHNSGASSTDAEMTDIGGCIALDSLVTEKTRGEIKISELTVGDEIKTHNDKWTTVKLIHHPIKKKGFKIKLKSGKYITASAEHVFPTNKGRLPTSKLEIGMKLNHNGVV
jgi:intein/homing endonuclease